MSRISCASFCFDGHAARYNCYRTGSVDRVLLQIRCTIEWRSWRKVQRFIIENFLAQSAKVSYQNLRKDRIVRVCVFCELRA